MTWVLLRTFYNIAEVDCGVIGMDLKRDELDFKEKTEGNDKEHSLLVVRGSVEKGSETDEETASRRELPGNQLEVPVALREAPLTQLEWVVTQL